MGWGDKKIGGTEQSPKIDPEIFQQTHKWENKVFSTYSTATTENPCGERTTFNFILHNIHKISMKWVINLNIEMRNLKLPEENTGDYLYDSKEDQENRSQKIVTIKQNKKNDTLDFIKMWNLSKNISLKIFLKIILGKNIHKTYMWKELVLRRYIFFSYN